jgi:bifunctional non-homologous end joining protein LigD
MLPPYRPQLALLVKAPPEGDEWLHEMKFDGYRIGVAIEGDEVRLLSRREKEWTDAFSVVVDGARRLPVKSALIDGELAGVLPDGRTSMHAMDSALAFFAFDIIHLDGEDLTPLPLDERKRHLARALGPHPPKPFVYVDHVVGGGSTFFAQACAMKIEGIVSKLRSAPYKTGARNASWQKVKCVLRQEFVIGGYERSVRDSLGALWLGTYDDAGRLLFAGKVGTGFQREAAAILAALGRIERASSPFANVGLPTGAKLREARWVTPTLVCEVAFMEWTGHDHIRHGSFQGMRPDKVAREVVRERPV